MNPARTPIMKKTRKSLKRYPFALLCLGMLLLPSCNTHRHQWTFSATRSVYGTGKGVRLSPGHWGHHHGGEGQAIFLAAIILLPVFIDLIVLPITLTHDLCDG